jgi:integrase
MPRDDPDDFEILPPAPRSLALSHHLAERAKEYSTHRRAKNTSRAYASDWRLFQTWCNGQGRGIDSMPAKSSTIAAFLLDMAEPSPTGSRVGGIDNEPRKPSTLQRYLSTISAAHAEEGFGNPCDDRTVRGVMAAIERKFGVAAIKKAPLEPIDLKKICDKLPNNLIGIRDRALLLLGFAGAMRRSEVASLSVRDLVFDQSTQGLKVRLGGVFVDEAGVRQVRRSKTNQAGQDEWVGIPPSKDPAYCPVTFVRLWLGRAGLRKPKDPVFVRLFYKDGNWLRGQKHMDPGSIARIVKRATASIGKSHEDFSGHSLRAGFVTAAAKSGKAVHEIMRTTRHKSMDTLAGYIRDADILGKGNAARGLL